MAIIKSPKDLSLIRVAGKKLAGVIEAACKHAKVGMTTLELDTFIHESILAEGCKPSFLGFEGFPKSACISINEQVVHGIPGSKVIQEGDLVGIDVGLWYEGVCVDGAETIVVGNSNAGVERLLKGTREALAAGIKAAKPYRRIGSISQAIQEVAESYDLGIIRALTGHGVGHHVHEAPEVPNTGRIGDGMLLRPGMVLAIEPMLTLGSAEVLTEVDGWAIITADGSLSAQFEHTVIITNKGAEIVTKTLA